jgi:phosphatidylserine/phosphatidylglycerophosphate/cardiolipin synthase-like enzyme
MLKKLLIVVLLVVNLFGYEKIYFLPLDTKKAQNEIVKQLNSAKKTIDIAMYNFKYRKFANALKQATKKGVDVKVYYYKKKIKFAKKIKALKVRTKLHTKIAIIDKKIAIFGSANWTKESFKKNYEVIYITDDNKIVNKFNNFIANIKRN